MSTEQFEQEYCERSGITAEEYHQYFTTKPCNCGDDSCLGYEVVSKQG